MMELLANAEAIQRCSCSSTMALAEQKNEGGKKAISHIG